MTFIEALYKSFQENSCFTLFVIISIFVGVVVVLFIFHRIVGILARIKITDKNGNTYSFAEKNLSDDQKDKIIAKIVTDDWETNMQPQPTVYQHESKDPRFKGQKIEVINCINCPRGKVCNFRSEYDAGDFSHSRRLPENIQSWIKGVYKEMQEFDWSYQPYSFVTDTKSLRGCKMLQLTHAFNVLGDTFSSFEDIKSYSKIRQKDGNV